MKKAAHKGGFSYPKLVILSEVSRQANAVEGPMHVNAPPAPHSSPPRLSAFPLHHRTAKFEKYASVVLCAHSPICP